MRQILKLVLYGGFGLTTTSAFAQTSLSFSFGAYGGRPLAPVLKIQGNQYSSVFGPRIDIHDPGYTYGPTISVNLTDRLAVQVDALYKPLRYDATFSSAFFVSYGNSSTLADWWEFPITAKWYLARRDIQPFIQGGISFNSVDGTTVFHTINPFNGTDVRSSWPFRLDKSPMGFVAGSGLEFKTWKIHIAPGFRYTHWTGATSEPGYYAEPDQFDVLVGFTFRIGNRAP
jgi:hypothetical protein